MKKIIVKILMFALCLSAVFFATSCSWDGGLSSEFENETNDQQSFIEFQTLAVEDLTVYGKVGYTTGEFSFANEVKIHGDSGFIVALDSSGKQIFDDKTVSLNFGDNTFYVIETKAGKHIKTYVVTIRRKPLYIVNFDVVGGSVVPRQYVEEGDFATEPTTEKAGCDFVSWDYKFSEPITCDITITAIWKGHTNTPYKVEYYLQGLDGGYELDHEENLQGTTDVSVTAEIKAFEHFSYSADISEINGIIHGDGSLVLKVYYTRNNYEIKTLSNNADAGKVNGAGTYGYGDQITLSATTYVGYNFVGWYDGENFVSEDSQFTFYVQKHIGLVAIFEVKPEMVNFNFISSLDYCKITGVKDPTITEIIIPDYVTAISGSTFYDCELLTSVVIGEGVVSISNNAFVWCYKLVEVVNKSPHLTITKGGSDNGNVGYNALAVYNCNDTFTGSKLSKDNGYIIYTDENEKILVGYSGTATTLSLPSYLTKINQYAFLDCYNLTSVVIGECVKSIDSFAFYGCDKLVEVINKSSNITAIKGSRDNGHLAYNALSVSNCDETYISKINNDNGYIIYSDEKEKILLGYNGNETELVIPDYITIINKYAFYFCKNLTSVEIGNGVSGIGKYAFAYCNNLTSVIIGNGVTSIEESAFYNCTSLNCVEIGDSVTDIGTSAFQSCESLTSIVLPDSVTSIGHLVFADCFKLTSINVSENNLNYKSIDGNLYSKDGSTFIQYAIGKNDSEFTLPNSVTCIGYSAFYSSKTLTTIIIGDNVESVEKSAFLNCRNLTSIVIEVGVTHIGDRAFYYCNSLADVYYKGTSESWQTILIEENNDELVSATKYYYIESEKDVPADGGNYWHYDENGEIAVWSEE